MTLKSKIVLHTFVLTLKFKIELEAFVMTFRCKIKLDSFVIMTLKKNISFTYFCKGIKM